MLHHNPKNHVYPRLHKCCWLFHCTIAPARERAGWTNLIPQHVFSPLGSACPVGLESQTFRRLPHFCLTSPCPHFAKTYDGQGRYDKLSAWTEEYPTLQCQAMSVVVIGSLAPCRTYKRPQINSEQLIISIPYFLGGKTHIFMCKLWIGQNWLHVFFRWWILKIY